MSESEEQHTQTFRVGVVYRDRSDDGRLVRERHSRPPMSVAGQVERERAAQRELVVPAFLEVAPGEFVPIEGCTVDQIAEAGREMLARARALMDEAKALSDFAWCAGHRPTG